MSVDRHLSYEIREAVDRLGSRMLRATASLGAIIFSLGSDDVRVRRMDPIGWIGKVVRAAVTGELVETSSRE